MIGCPYCGEKIVPEARVCRFCNRNILYSAVLTASLDERQAHRFIKEWNKHDKKHYRHLPLSNYSQSKSELNKIPLTVAWDLTQADAQKLFQHFSEFHIEPKLQGGLPSSYSEEVANTSKSFDWTSIAYGTLALLFIAIAAMIWMNNHRGKSQENLALRDAIQEMQKRPALDLPSYPKQRPEQMPTSAHDKAFGRSQMEHLLNASVFIKDKNTLGSGFLITSDGYILSNAHVTSGMSDPQVVLRDGRQFTAQKIKEDVKLDASLLKISAAGLEALKLGNANDLFPGQPVVTIGNPGGLSFTVTRGIVSYLGRVISGVPFIQTDAAINRGNSGGPMINEALEVVGINSMTSLGEQGISFALPINLVCASGGIASGVGTTPPWCETLEFGQDIITPAMLERQKPEEGPQRKKAPDSQMYQSEVDSYRAELNRAESEIATEQTAIETKIADLQSEARINADNLSRMQDLQSQMNDLKTKLTELPRRKAEAQIRYLKQCISTLQRQKTDPDYEGLASQIETQMNALIAQQKTLEAALGH